MLRIPPIGTITAPGGWNIIGRTPLRPFDAARQSPSLFRPGDHVRFRPIDSAEFDGFAPGASS